MIFRSAKVGTLAFSEDSLYLALISDTPTVHVFKLEKNATCYNSDEQGQEISPTGFFFFLSTVLAKFSHF